MGPVSEPAPAPKTLSCGACGAPLVVRAPGHSVVVSCGACNTVLDAEHPDRVVIEGYQRKLTVTPLIPLGSRGKLKGELFEVIGFLVREAQADGESFSWSEHLLFNPYQGLRWLAEYQGHFTLSKAASGYPKTQVGRTVEYLGATYRHFQKATPRITYVLGEFPWQARVGEKAVLDDYIDPPNLLSREKTGAEVTWSVGEHVEGAEVWKAFSLTGSPPARSGVGAAQPSPYARHRRSMTRLFLAFVGAAILFHIIYVMSARNAVVYQDRFTAALARNARTEQGGGTRTTFAAPAMVTPVFELPGRRANVRVEIGTDVSNGWAYFTLALINETTGDAVNFGREISYYFGSDSDGAWSEGASGDQVYLPPVAPGRYYLLVEAEADRPALTYHLLVRHDVPRMVYLPIALAILAVPPAIFWYRERRFEFRRWSESDHPMWPSED
jgi:hypothetical protein